jgi:hypothetical protein
LPGDSDIVVDDNGFVLIPGEYENFFLLPWYAVTVPDRINVRYPQKLTGFVGFGLHYLVKAALAGHSWLNSYWKYGDSIPNGLDEQPAPEPIGKQAHCS